jgi:nucleoside-diphosphate kinase
MEKTFVMIKPDGVKRGLTGQVIARIERAGFTLVALKMVHPSRELVETHYPSSDAWFTTSGKKTLQFYKETDLDIKEHLGTDSALEIGRIVKQRIIDFVSSGPVVCMVWEGNDAVEKVRQLVGTTFSIDAFPGTIRGDFACDSPDLSNKRYRSVRNVVHASKDHEEAFHEIRLWFSEEELYRFSALEN